MKRFYSILLGLGILTFGGVSFTSCDSNDDSLDDSSIVKNEYFKINMMDTTYVRTENINAYLNIDGTFELNVLGFTSGAVDGFVINLLKFQEGNFPTNVNPVMFNIGLNDGFISQDLNDPTRNNGLIKVTKIDKQNKLISGTFKTRMMPLPFNSALTQNLSIDGEFRNIRYERRAENEDGTFFYAASNNEEIRDFVGKSNTNGDVLGGNVFIIAESKYMRKRSLSINFPKELGVGKYGYDKVNVLFSSADGVGYKSGKDNMLLGGSYFQIDKIENAKKSNHKLYSGTFFFKLVDKDGKITEVKDGDFKALVNMKEQ